MIYSIGRYTAHTQEHQPGGFEKDESLIGFWFYIGLCGLHRGGWKRETQKQYRGSSNKISWSKPITNFFLDTSKSLVSVRLSRGKEPCFLWIGLEGVDSGHRASNWNNAFCLEHQLQPRSVQYQIRLHNAAHWWQVLYHYFGNPFLPKAVTLDVTSKLDWIPSP